MDLSQNQAPIQQNSQPNPYPPNQNFPSQSIPDNQLQTPEKKTNWVKTCLIIVIIVIILGAGGYLGYKYYFIKYISKSETATSPSPVSSKAMATIEGNGEKLTVEMPAGYTQGNPDQFGSYDSGAQNIVIIFNLANNKDANNGSKAKIFGMGFLAENKYNDYKKGIEHMKQALALIRSELGAETKDSEVTINNYRLLKNEGKIKNKDGSENFLTEYYIFTNQSYFFISRLNPVNEPNFAEEEFNQMLNSFKITPK